MTRTVLITGCSDGGLGAALAVAFHQHGDRVIATTRNVSKMTELKKTGVETLALDVSSEESIKAAVAKVSEMTGGSLDILINNAGAGLSLPVLDLNIDEVRNLFDLNVFSAVRMTQLFLPLLRKAKPFAIVANNTSAASVLNIPWQGAYNASKAALAMFNDTMRLELQPLGIKVIDLKTGTVRSNFFQNANASSGIKLPETSAYKLNRERIESHDTIERTYMTAETYAQKVVSDLSLSNPPAQIWRGADSSKAWFATNLSLRMKDNAIKGDSGLDELEKKLKTEA